MAIEDFGGSIGGKKIEIVQADVQNKADVAATIAGRWFDTEQVDVILGTGASSSSIATSRVANDKKKIYLATDPASSDLTGKLCNAYTVHWTYDTFALANGTGSAVVKAGGKSWFFLTADYAFGYALQRDVANVVNKDGGKVLGEVRHPINTNDFSSFLLQAQASKAQIIGLANAGGDTINSIKQASEFGIVKGGQKLAGLLVFVYRRALARPGARPGPEPDRGLLLGPQRQDARLLQALRREEQRQDADQHPGRLLFGGAAVPQRRQGGQHRQ